MNKEDASVGGGGGCGCGCGWWVVGEDLSGVVDGGRWMMSGAGGQAAGEGLGRGLGSGERRVSGE